eukprot:4949143-Prymnesium_polylepis.1
MVRERLERKLSAGGGDCASVPRPNGSVHAEEGADVRRTTSPVLDLRVARLQTDPGPNALREVHLLSRTHLILQQRREILLPRWLHVQHDAAARQQRSQAVGVAVPRHRERVPICDPRRDAHLNACLSRTKRHDGPASSTHV